MYFCNVRIKKLKEKKLGRFEFTKGFIIFATLIPI
jgi:hypothetical protein